MKEFTFTGTAAITRKFSIKIAGSTYEEAQEKALYLLEDVDDPEYFETGNDSVDIDISEYESEIIHPRAFNR